ncbi:hyalin-like [Antedon mediterranea]|uniref:hyalin-like n=1 Tax=Antedon mediterranea TaxID=105859 RepID=UPI003AF5E4A7
MAIAINCKFKTWKLQDNERSIIDCPTNVTSNNYIGGVSGLINIQTDQKSPNATVTWDPPVTSGNGTVTVVSSPYESGDMIPIGTHTITFTATDLFGNNGTCDFVIKVEDATAELQSETTNSTMENGSCVGKCGRWDKNCYCDNACEGLNDCCPDYLLLCQNISLGTEIVTEWVTITDAKADLQSETTNSTMVNGSCLGKCGRWDKNCYCDNICEELTDCCPDYLLLCQNISLGTEIVTEWVTITDATTDFQKESSISTIVNDCVENIYLNSNDVINITSSNYPDNYDNNENCEWIVESPQNTGILLTFYDIELESCCDFLIITYVDVNGDTLLIEWNSNNSLLVTTHLNITFQTDLSVVNRGFALGLKIINIDQEAPDIINCPWDLTVNTSVEAFAINVTWVEPTATDNSGETPVPVADYTSGDNMFGIGNTTIQYNVSDSAGNFNDSCTFVIHVEDNESPTIDCPANVTSNNYIGEGYGLVNVSTDIGSPNATVTWDPPVTSENSGGLVTIMSSSFDSGDMIPYGTHTITFTATDPYGNSDTCVFGLKVEDNEDPVLVCAPNITTTTADGSNQALNVSWTDPIVIDNSGEDIKPTSKYYPGNNEFDIGRTDVIYDSVDSSRNSATCTFTVTVIDPEAPDIIGCTIGMIFNTTTGEAFAINVTWMEPTAIDNSGETPVPVADYSSDDNMFPIGDTTVQYNVSDSAGNFNDSCNFVIIVEDNESPMIYCPTNVTSNNYIRVGYELVNVSTDIGSPNATVTWDPPETSDNSGRLVTVMSSSFESGDMIPYGTHTITFTATDPYGNIDTCDFGLNVEDNEDPVLVCPPNIATITADGSDQAVNVTWTDPIVNDNSGEDITPTSKYNPGNNEFYIGIIDVMYDAVDSSGNAATCTFTITVTDNESPTIDCPSNVTSNNYIGERYGLVNVSTDIGSPNATVTWDPLVTSDNSGGLVTVISSSFESGDMIPYGTHTIKFTASDSFGNIDTCDFGLQVEDNEDPVLVCPPDIKTNTADGSNHALYVNWTYPIVIDNSGEDITPTSKYNPGNNEFDIGSTYVIYDSVDSSGNAATCTFIVTVTDPEAPDIIDCPIGGIVNTTTGAAFAINVTWVEPTATDNSGETPVPVADYTSSDNMFAIGKTTVQYNVSDSAGNVNASCSFVITVQDEQDPEFIFCPDSIFTETGHRSSTARVSWDTPEIEDNSGQVSLVASTSPGSSFNIGTTSVVYTASDNSNNMNKCEFNVTVEDNEPPVLECPDDIIDIATTTSGIAITWPDARYIDNSGKSVLLNSTSNSGDIFTFGTHTVIYTGFDQSENSGTCQFEIKIGDSCTSSPCQNGGTCVQLETSFACNCPVLYEGNLCQILPGEPTAEIQPFSLSANLQNTVTFQCTVTYSINWRWYKDDIELPSETQSLKFLTINEVGLENQGYYYCKAFGVSPHDDVKDMSMKAVLVVADAFTVPTVLTFKNLQFTSALNNPSSKEFKNTSTEIENLLTESISITDIFVQVRALRSGSVIANINIYKPSADQSYNNFSKSLAGEFKKIGDKGVIDADNIVIFSTESCNIEIIDGLTFGPADVGQNTQSEEICPESKINYGMPLGLCTCYSDGLSAAVWQNVILQDCGRDATSDELLERLNMITVTEENAEEVITAVNNITTTESDTITPEGLEATAEIIESVTSVNSTSAEVTSTLVGTVASLFEVDDDVLLESQMQTQAPSRIVESLEEQLAVVDLKNDKYEFVTSSVAVQAQSVKTNELDYTGIGIASYQSADTNAIVKCDRI